MKKIKKRKKQCKKCKKYLKKLAFLPEIGYNINITYETLKEWEQIPLFYHEERRKDVNWQQNELKTDKISVKETSKN